MHQSLLRLGFRVGLAVNTGHPRGLHLSLDDVGLFGVRQHLGPVERFALLLRQRGVVVVRFVEVVEQRNARVVGGGIRCRLRRGSLSTIGRYSGLRLGNFPSRFELLPHGLNSLVVSAGSSSVGAENSAPTSMASIGRLCPVADLIA